MTRIPHGHVRLSFGGLAELFLESAALIVGRATMLSEVGCFVKTPSAAEIGAGLTLKITYAAKEFAAAGEIVRVDRGVGLGIAFDPISATDQDILDAWLIPEGPHVAGAAAPRLRTAFQHDFCVPVTCLQCQQRHLVKMSSLRTFSVVALPCGHTLGANQITGATEQQSGTESVSNATQLLPYLRRLAKWTNH